MKTPSRADRVLSQLFITHSLTAEEVRLADIQQVVPPQIDYSGPEFPDVPSSEYRQRLELAEAGMRKLGLDFLVIYGDREHAATLAFLTGFDPRFEESLLVLNGHGGRLLLVGNESLGYLPTADLDLEIRWSTGFSLQDQELLAQSRVRQTRPVGNLSSCLADFGMRCGAQVGCAGWKTMRRELLDDPEHSIEIPAFVVDALRRCSAPGGEVRNANSLFLDYDLGLRVTHSLHQIAILEQASIRTSRAVRSAMSRLAPGVHEFELEAYLQPYGAPLSCHTMVSFGEKAKRGLSSPGPGRASLGDSYTVTLGIRGALTSRAGVIAASPTDLAWPLQPFYEHFVRNYFDVICAWYQSIKVGVAAGDVYAAVEQARDPRLFELFLNPGHLLHLEEWSGSPFRQGDQSVLRSGMALQSDIIPVSVGPFCYANLEDGVILADEELRADITGLLPAASRRIQQRRKYMIDALGIRLHESVLPLSDMPAWLPPYVQDPDVALVNDG